MLRGHLKSSELRLLLDESLAKSYGDVVELDRDLVEQLALALDHLIASVDDVPNVGTSAPKKQSKLFK